MQYRTNVQIKKMKDTKSHIAIIVEAAQLYYKYNFNQQKIAQKIGVSRPGVSRLLQEARDRGIVKIDIIDPLNNGTEIENKLKHKFNLKKVIIVPNIQDDDRVIKKRLGKAAALLLDELINSDAILGVSWGTTMQEISRHIRNKKTDNVVVVQLNGGVSKAEYDTHASEIAQKIGEAYSATPYLLPLPAIVDKPDVKRAIVSDKNISQILDFGKLSNIAMFTIGLFNHDSVLVKSDYLNYQKVESLIEKGAIGDICSRIIDQDGNICSKDLNSRTIGIELRDLSKKEYSIAVAGGLKKFPAIQAALKGNLFNVLITDEQVGNRLLKLETR